jgi:hypothetical protein
LERIQAYNAYARLGEASSNFEKWSGGKPVIEKEALNAVCSGHLLHLVLEYLNGPLRFGRVGSLGRVNAGTP